MADLSKWLNKITCGDGIAVMDQMPEKSVDLVVTSPPYNLRNSSGNGMHDGRGGLWESAKLLTEKGYDKSEDNMPHEEYVAWQRAYIKSMLRVIKPDGAIFYNHKCRVQNGLWQNRWDILDGFPVRQEIIWHRKGGMNFNKNQCLVNQEYIYVICPKAFRFASKVEGVVYDEDNWCYSMGSVWSITQDKGNDHPAPFPVKLAKRCIEITNAKIILDPFSGSGSTAIAAEILGRDWIGIEISGKYCKKARRRIEKERNARAAD